MRFCKEYLIDLSPKAAAIRSGYSAKNAATTGYILMQKKDVREEIQRLMTARSLKLEIDADYVLIGITEVIERCKQAEPVRDSKGNPIGEYTFNAAGCLKGYELLGKHLKLFTDKIEHTGRDGKELFARNLTDDELAAIIKA